MTTTSIQPINPNEVLGQGLTAGQLSAAIETAMRRVIPSIERLNAQDETDEYFQVLSQPEIVTLLKSISHNSIQMRQALTLLIKHLNESRTRRGRIIRDQDIDEYVNFGHALYDSPEVDTSIAMLRNPLMRGMMRAIRKNDEELAEVRNQLRGMERELRFLSDEIEDARKDSRKYQSNMNWAFGLGSLGLGFFAVPISMAVHGAATAAITAGCCAAGTASSGIAVYKYATAPDVSARLTYMERRMDAVTRSVSELNRQLLDLSKNNGNVIGQFDFQNK